MKLLEKILLPIDINHDYNKQVDSAIRIAKEFKSEVSLMFILPETKVHPEITELLTKYINEKLADVLKVFKKEEISYTEPVIDAGIPVDKILQAATEQKANLILISSGNKLANEEFKLGTTAEKLIQLSDVPVWVAKSDEATKFKRILCPVDFSDPSKRALQNAILLSNNFDSKLVVLGVFEPFSTASPRIDVDPESENETLFKQFKKNMNEFISEFNLKGVNHKIDIQAGNPHEEIFKSIQNNNIDLLVMGTNGRSGLSRILMGSVTEKVVRELPCSFVTTKTQNIYKLRFDNEIKEIETHFNNAAQLQKSGFIKEAIDQCLICLQINDMHIPSIYKLAELYKILGDEKKVAYYDKMGTSLLRRLWDKKIEYEIRKHYKSSNWNK